MPIWPIKCWHTSVGHNPESIFAGAQISVVGQHGRRGFRAVLFCQQHFPPIVKKSSNVRNAGIAD